LIKIQSLKKIKLFITFHAFQNSLVAVWKNISHPDTEYFRPVNYFSILKHTFKTLQFLKAKLHDELQVDA
jgi:hypothetical protein